MSDHKITGCCSRCDAPCFDVLETQGTNDRNPGDPKRLGHPLPEATRISFLLYDGSKTDLTFCGDCAGLPSLAPDFIELWAKNVRSWARELGEQRPEWFMKQYANGLLCEIGRKTWKELVRNG